jgi:DNA-binding transcriptional LysR family regulator
MTRTHPRAAFKVLEGSWKELVEPLRDGEIDMIVGALRPFDIADLYQMPLYEDRLVMRREASIRLLESSSRLWSNWPPIAGSCHRPIPLREQWEQFSGHNHAGNADRMRFGDDHRPVADRGQFLTLLSPDQVALQIRSGLLTQIGAPLEHSRRVMGITTRRSWRPTATQRHFLDCLEQAAA